MNRSINSLIKANVTEILSFPKKRFENLYKTSLCKSVQTKKSCEFGNKCNFAHSISELRKRKCMYGPACVYDRCDLDHDDCSVEEFVDKLTKELQSLKFKEEEKFSIDLKDDDDEESNYVDFNVYENPEKLVIYKNESPEEAVYRTLKEDDVKEKLQTDNCVFPNIPMTDGYVDPEFMQWVTYTQNLFNRQLFIQAVTIRNLQKEVEKLRDNLVSVDINIKM